MTRKKTLALLVGTLFALASFAAEPPPASPAQEALEKGDLALAKELFAKELAENPESAAAKRTSAFLKKILQNEADFASESNKERKLQLAKSLRAAYLQLGLSQKALETDQKAYGLEQGQQQALNLSMSQLRVGQDAEALKTLSSIDETSATPQAKMLKAVALGRNGEKGKAAETLGKLNVDDLKSAPEKLLYAQAAAAAGKKDEAVAGIAKLLAGISAKKHEGAVRQISAIKDFAPYLEDKDFKAALASVGDDDDCANCKNKASCKDSKSKPEGKCPEGGCHGK